ncbi:hypothetical protein GCM10009850_111240 [Nonomuraea monospora]|uniref:Uncharacterized protein n=1 Tax=Nonomuraea monospora TaxID=568818 RepID=A0ABP5PVA2_9ACTN
MTVWTDGNGAYFSDGKWSLMVTTPLNLASNEATLDMVAGGRRRARCVLGRPGTCRQCPALQDT